MRNWSHIVILSHPPSIHRLLLSAVHLHIMSMKTKTSYYKGVRLYMYNNYKNSSFNLNDHDDTKYWKDIVWNLFSV